MRQRHTCDEGLVLKLYYIPTFQQCQRKPLYCNGLSIDRTYKCTKTEILEKEKNNTTVKTLSRSLSLKETNHLTHLIRRFTEYIPPEFEISQFWGLDWIGFTFSPKTIHATSHQSWPIIGQI